jgi:hypothetical protein
MFPPDIWKFEIAPYLDYNSRIELSRSLPPGYRLKPRKFTKEEIISHSSSSVYETLRTRIQKIVEIKERQDKINFVNGIFKLILTPLFYNILSVEQFRDVLQIKCIEYKIDIERSDDYDEFYDTLTTLLGKIRTYDYSLKPNPICII